MKPIFFKFSGKKYNFIHFERQNIISCILKGELPFKMQEIIFFIQEKKCLPTLPRFKNFQYRSPKHTHFLFGLNRKFWSIDEMGFFQHSTNAWLPPLLQALMRHIYQRALLESKADILEILVKLWCKLLEKSPLDLLVGAATPWLGVWFSLAMQPSKVPFDGAYFIEAKHRGRVSTVKCLNSKV